MKTYFKLEFKKNMFSWKTLISIIIILASLVIPNFKGIIFPHPDIDGIDKYIRISYFSYRGFIGPVVAGWIYSTSIIRDKESGFRDKLLEIIDVKTFFKVKLAVNALITFIVFLISHGILILYLIFIFGINNIAVKDIEIGVFASVYEASKILYIILTLLAISLTAAAFSVFVFGVATATEGRLIAYVLPVTYVIITGILFEMWSFNNVVDFNVTTLFNPAMKYRNANALRLLIYDLMLALSGVVLIYKFGYKRTRVLLQEA